MSGISLVARAKIGDVIGVRELVGEGDAVTGAQRQGGDRQRDARCEVLSVWPWLPPPTGTVGERRRWHV